MTILQLILLVSFGVFGLIMYKAGFNDGIIEGRIEQFQAKR